MKQGSFLSRFRRITYSTSYLPAIDGLRFLAIFSVVVIMHISHYMDDKFFGGHLISNPYWHNFLMEGGNGVPLFFMISGFILSLPFARWRLDNEAPVRLRNYYLRRLTRLEPPYIIALLIFFLAHVWVLHTYTFQELLPRFFASAFYLHTAIYKEFSTILPIAWSLEVEVQFYLLAPLFFLIFMMRSAVLRRSLMLLIIAGSALYWFDKWQLPHLLMYLQYFFSGILAADLYVSKRLLFRSQHLSMIAGLLALGGFLFIPSIHNFYGYLIKLLCMFILMHTVLTNRVIEKIFSYRVIAIIGGMCYSIYLLHFAIVSFFGQLLMRSGFRVDQYRLLPLYYFIFISSVLLLSSVYFLWVERPFMRRKV